MNNNAKINIKEKLFYTQIFFLFITVILLTIYFLDCIIIGTNAYDKLTPAIQNKKLKMYITGKIISYIINCFILLVYLVYLIMSRHKLKVGYLFCILWFILFIALAASPHVLTGSHDEEVRLATGIAITIMISSILVCISIMARKIFNERKISKYESYKIHKQKKGI